MSDLHESAPRPHQATKRGRPISIDPDSQIPQIAARREHERSKRQRNRVTGKQRKAAAQAQRELAAANAHADPSEREDQAALATLISTRPSRASGEPALCQIPEDEPEPAIFEGGRIGGFGGLPEGDWREFEDEPSLYNQGPGRPRGSATPRASAQARSSKARGKMPARPSTSSSTTSLTAWLTRPGPSIRPSPSVSQPDIQESFLDNTENFEIDNDYTEDEDPSNVGTGDKAAQVAAAIILSLREQKDRDNTRSDLDRPLHIRQDALHPPESSTRSRVQLRAPSTLEQQQPLHPDQQQESLDVGQIGISSSPNPGDPSVTPMLPDDEPQINPPDIEDLLHETEDEDDSEIDAEGFVINKILDSWYGRFPGCLPQEHQATQATHHAERPNPDDHYALTELLPQPLPFNALDHKGFLTAEQVAAGGGMPDAATLKSIYCGISPEEEHLHSRHICLDKHLAPDSPLDVAYDVDSYCGIANTLSIALGGIDIQTVSNERQNIRQSIHGHIKVLDAAGQLLELRDIPHQYIGRLGNDYEVQLWVLYPRCRYEGKGDFRRLTDEQLTHWNNRIWLPILYQVLPGHALQDQPSSYRDADNKARAGQLENRVRDGNAYNTRQTITNHIQPQYLTSITRALRDKVQQPAHHEFKGFQIYFCAKGVKNKFKTTVRHPRLQDSMTQFLNHLGKTLDRQLIPWDRFWIDIGKEHCVRASYVTGAPPTPNQAQPQTYLPRKCCLRKYHDWYYQQDKRPRAASTTLYSIAMLGEAASLTTTPPLDSYMRRGGLIYTQVYARVKTMLEAAKHFTLQQDGLEEIALDPNVAAGIRDAAGGRSRQISVIERAYLAGKKRLNQALHDCQYKSYGIREEHRITFRCFLTMWDILDASDDGDVGPQYPLRPLFVFAVPTVSYTEYLRQHAGKFITGFELVRVRSAANVKTWEQTKMMTMFLRCLRYATGDTSLAVKPRFGRSRQSTTMVVTIRV